ncbi:major facilitator superfamily domain-containing protein [Rhypophila decipiens]|uniref:Major facilitator superfamily domain-containing protein n=1 Tax=Rhypophila decipiens TaxID=261697 RepID=A0AAN7B3I8_9PEZI|nr:major facilitator superfamily domain-containing protein [Rhypophila decipiens]
MTVTSAADDTGHHAQHGGDNESFSTAATYTATENTPLLGSQTPISSDTVNDCSALTDPEDGVTQALSDQDEDASSISSSDETWSRGRAVCIILSMWALIFLQASNMSGITTTQSTIAADLDAYEYAMWFTSSYMMTMSSISPLMGRLSMIFTPGTMILISSFFFSAGAVVTSQAQSFAVFILGRILVGVGGGGILTLAMILVIQLTSKKRRGLWIGLTNAGFTVSVSMGALIFGALLPVMGWRALFLVQCPIGILGGLGVYMSMPSSILRAKGFKETKTTAQKLASIDYAGAVTLTLTTVLFLYGLAGTQIQPTPILISLPCLFLFLFIESRAPDPILPLSILRSRGILLSCIAQLFLMAVRWTVLFYAPIFVLAVRGLSPAMAGSVLIPTNIGFGLGGLVVGWLHIRRSGDFYSPSLITIVSFAAFILSLAYTSNLETGWWVYILMLFGNGWSTGAQLNYSLAHLLHLSRPETHFIVTGLLATFRGFAGSFGTSIGGGVFNRTLRGLLGQGFRRLDGGGQLSKAREELIKVLIGSPAKVYEEGLLNAAEREIAVLGYEATLRVLYTGAAAVCVLVFVLQAGTGWNAPRPVVSEEDIEDEVEEAVADGL